MESLRLVLNGGMICEGVDFMSALRQAVQKREADQAVAMRFVVGQALGSTMNENAETPVQKEKRLFAATAPEFARRCRKSRDDSLPRRRD
jgi:hypothetical protein